MTKLTQPQFPFTPVAGVEEATVPEALVVESFGLTDPGRVRPNNEDQFVIAELAKAMRIQQSSLPQRGMRYSDVRGHLFLLADGMGGHQGGEHASSAALSAMEQFILNTLKWFFQLQGAEGDTLVQEFQRALRQADHALFEEAAQHRELHGMGTTLTMAYSIGTHLFVVHVGDSRCYLFRAGQLHRLTRDHTLIEEMLSRGMIDRAGARTHPYRHVITNCIGGSEPGLHVEAHKIDLEAGDRILLCSDGLTDMVPDDDLQALLASEREPRTACERLVSLANERGGRDNVTVIVANFDKSSWQESEGPPSAR